MARTILVIDDENNMRWVLDRVLQKAGYDVVTASRGDEGLRQFARHDVDLVLLDLKMPGMDGLSVLRTLRERGTQVPILLLTAFATISTAIEALKIGATDYVRKPFDVEDLQTKISHAINGAARSPNEDRRTAVPSQAPVSSHDWANHLPETLIGISSAVARLQNVVEVASTTDYALLIKGETGTGCQALARFIHICGIDTSKVSTRSSSASKPCVNNLVSIDCSTLPASVIEQEFAGLLDSNDKEGTQPSDGHLARWETSLGGTLVVANIDALQLEWLKRFSNNIQSYLRSPQRPHGLRLIFTLSVDKSTKSNNQWDTLIPQAITINLPPLRDRLEDIPFLVANALPEVSWSTEALEALAAHSWPRNVAELRQTIAYASTISNSQQIELKHLPPNLNTIGEPEAESRNEPRSGRPFELPRDGVNLDAVEQNLIEQALERAEGNKAKAARLLGISRSTLLYRLEKYGLSTAGGE